MLAELLQIALVKIMSDLGQETWGICFLSWQTHALMCSKFENSAVVGCWTNAIATCASLLRNYKLGSAFTREDEKCPNSFEKKHAASVQWPSFFIFLQHKHGDGVQEMVQVRMVQ